MGVSTKEVFECNKCKGKVVDPDWEAKAKWFELRSMASLTNKENILICASCKPLFHKWLDTPLPKPHTRSPYR